MTLLSCRCPLAVVHVTHGSIMSRVKLIMTLYNESYLSSMLLIHSKRWHWHDCMWKISDTSNSVSLCMLSSMQLPAGTYTYTMVHI